jgi:hypothetical protein
MLVISRWVKVRLMERRLQAVHSSMRMLMWRISTLNCPDYKTCLRWLNRHETERERLSDIVMENTLIQTEFNDFLLINWYVQWYLSQPSQEILQDSVLSLPLLTQSSSSSIKKKLISFSPIPFVLYYVSPSPSSRLYLLTSPSCCFSSIENARILLIASSICIFTSFDDC